MMTTSRLAEGRVMVLQFRGRRSYGGEKRDKKQLILVPWRSFVY